MSEFLILSLSEGAWAVKAPGRLRVMMSTRGMHHSSVVNGGTGIALVNLLHAFERFYKPAHSTGSELGLAHGGEIEAVSAAGCGTTIRFTLPLEPSAGSLAAA